MKNKFVSILIGALIGLGSFSVVSTVAPGAVSSFVSIAYGQTATPASPEIGHKAEDAVKGATSGVEKVGAFLEAQSGVLAVILGVLFTLSKALSNEKAGVVVRLVQGLFDAAAGLLLALGGLLRKLSELLAKVLASDGYLGKR